MVGTRLLTSGVGGYRRARGGGWNDSHSNGLELERSWLNRDADGHIWKYLQICLYMWLSSPSYIFLLCQLKGTRSNDTLVAMSTSST